MANSFYGLNRGKQLVEQVTEGAASAPSTDVEIRINRSAGLSRLEALLLIDTIKYNILHGDWPPVAASSPPPPPPPPPAVETTFDAYYAPGFALLQSTANRTYSLVSKPAKTGGVASAGYTDALHGTRVYRLTNASAEGNGSARLRHEYSRRNPFNCDSTRYLAQTTSGYWMVFDANTFAKISQPGVGGSVPGMAGDCEAFWHPTDPNKIWYTDNYGGLAYYEYNLSTGTSTTLFDLTGRFPAGLTGTERCSTRSEGRPSIDGRYWAFACLGPNFTFLGTLTYDRVLDQVIGWTVGGNAPNNVTISPLGNYVVLGSDFSGGPGGVSGNYIVPRDAKTSASYDTVGTLAFSQPQHMDCALGPNNEEYLVYLSYDEDAGYIRCYNMATGVSFRLPITLYPATGEGCAAHISGIVSHKRKGWAIVSTYASGANYGSVTPAPTVRHIYDRIMLVELVPNGRVLHVAEHHSSGSFYFNEPQATSNEDGTRIVWASGFNGRAGPPTDDTESFMVGLPSWAIPSA